MPKSRPPYPEKFRREAVQLVRSGRTIKDVAESLGVTEQSLRTWVKRDQRERRERDERQPLAKKLNGMLKTLRVSNIKDNYYNDND